MSKHNRVVGAVGAAAILALTASPALAQVPLAPRALGMGGAYVGTARGYEALFLNPANLGLAGRAQWSIALAQASAGGTLLGPDLAELPDILEAKDWEEARQNELLARIPATGTEAQFDIRAPLFGLQVGGFALGVGYGSVGQHSVSRDIVDLLVKGYEENRTDYSVGNTSGSRMTYWDVAAGYGRRFGALSLGATGHYIRGGTTLRSRMFEPTIDVEARDIEVNYVAVIARGGTGYSVDFGAAYQPSPAVTVSAALANAVTKMEWSEDLYVRDLRLRRSDIEDLGFLDLKEKYEATEEPLDPTGVPTRVYDTAQGLYDAAYFPTTLRTGLDWKATGGTNLGLGYEKQLTEGSLASRWEQTASIGVQQRLPLITVRAGFATDLDQGSMISGGLTLGPMQLGVAKLTESSDGSNRSGWIASFGLGVSAFAPR